jgi:general secretion pathway protein E
VVMIGEIRDLETARAAIQASLTGHLVLSTLHTNDAASAPTRLIDMGVEPYLVSSTLIGSMAQRLVRRICSKCRHKYHPDPQQLPKDFAFKPGEQLWRGQGCPHCRHTGYRGRTGLYELMVMNEAIAQQVMKCSSAQDIGSVALKSGLRLLREDGWLKVRHGVTTPEEVLTCTAV